MKEDKVCTIQNYNKICPIYNTHDKLIEAHYYLFKMIETYHFPIEFRFSLNAFIQSLRNVTFAIQADKHNIPNFDEWYKVKQENMRSNQLLRKFVEGRNIIVKQGNLTSKSKAKIGLFRERKEKLVLSSEFDPFIDNEKLLELGKRMFIGVLLDEEHTAIGEQIGIKREWITEEIGETEIVSLCIEALHHIQNVVSEAHDILGFKLNMEDNYRSELLLHTVLLETDVNPELFKKWDW